jgi:hypothetical protein
MRFPIATALALATGIGLIAACSGSSGGSNAEPIPEHPDFTGTWVLNSDLSEDPEAQARGGGRRPPSGSGDGAPPPGAQGPSRGRVPFDPGTVLPSLAFKIVEDDSTLTFMGVDGRERVIFQDGREESRRVEDLGIVRISGRWKGDKFVLDRQLEGGAVISEEYEMSDDGLQLLVKVKIKAGRTIEFRRVYDAGDEKH